MENTNKMNCVIDLKKVLLERFKEATVITGLIGNQSINRKLLEPKKITYQKDVNISDIFFIDWNELARDILYRFEKNIVYKLEPYHTNYDNLVIGVWGGVDIIYDLKPEEDKIRIIYNAYLDAVTK